MSPKDAIRLGLDSSQMIIDAYKGPKRVITMKDTTHWQSVPESANGQLLDDIEWLWQGGKP